MLALSLLCLARSRANLETVTDIAAVLKRTILKRASLRCMSLHLTDAVEKVKRTGS